MFPSSDLQRENTAVGQGAGPPRAQVAASLGWASHKFLLRDEPGYHGAEHSRSPGGGELGAWSPEPDPSHLFLPPVFTEHLLYARQRAAQTSCAGRRASTWCLSCPRSAYSLVGGTDINQIIPPEGVKWQVGFMELVREVVEAAMEEGRFEVRGEGITRVT